MTPLGNDWQPISGENRPPRSSHDDWVTALYALMLVLAIIGFVGGVLAHA